MKELMISAGCSVLSNQTDDNHILMGRNMDFNRISEGTKIIKIMKNTIYYLEGCDLEKNLKTKKVSKYDVLGIGTDLLKPTVAIYDGFNEHGLAGAQLYFRNNASYSDEIKDNTEGILAPYLVFHLLACCKDILEVYDLVSNNLTLLNKPLLNTIAPLHWFFIDRSNKTLVIEQEKDGLNLYLNQIGILTNSPNFKWHLTNLENYMNLDNQDKDSLEINNYKVKQSFSGHGLQGLPGDFSSPSRFIRLAFFKKYALKGKSLAMGVNALFHQLDNVAFIKGLVSVTDLNKTMYDQNILTYDYTIYSVIYDLTNLNIYFKTYDNQNIKILKFSDEINLSLI